jgi:hypothetical protein
MASSLPTDSAATKAVDTFGIGTYDSLSDSSLHGEDDESREPTGQSLPGTNGVEGFEPELYLGYPQDLSQGPKHASGMLPGDISRPARGPQPSDLIYDGLASPPSDIQISNAKLPNDDTDPVSRSDYYDEMIIGNTSDIWADEDSGVYATQDSDSFIPEVESLPTPEFNDNYMDNFLGALGNSDSGYVVEDLAVPFGFPSDQFTEEADFLDENPILPEVWHLQPFGYASSGSIMNKIATNISLVENLTQQFLKEFGRKNLVRRHVLAFLQERNEPQYLASDIIRCMKHQYDIVIPDVMDIFPIAKTASNTIRRISYVHDKLVEAMIEHAHDPVIARQLRKCATDTVTVLVGLSALEERNG